MPFVSDAQRRFMYAVHPRIARRWSRHAKELEGRKKAAAAYGLEKVSFSFGGLARGAARWGSRALGMLPTGVGNALAGGLGAVGGFADARAQGHGLGVSMLHGAAGATAGIPGGVGLAASMAAPMALNKLVPPPPPPAVGQNITG